MSESKVTRSAYLRPEARPFTWDALNDSQKDAFGRLVDVMIDAVEAIDTRGEGESRGVDDVRSNQTVLIAGDRGMGKTSLMLSLQKSISNPKHRDDSDDERWTVVREKIKDKLRDRLVWLEPLDMESLPGPTNLLVSILARIEHAMDQSFLESDTPQGLLNPRSGVEEAQMELRRLKSDASLAWEGNIRERAAQLDPDMYAHEVMRAEKARLSLNRRLNLALDRLAKRINWSDSVKSPMFILPVDDFDLNPVRCLELLRLIRAIAVPRLFAVVLGDDVVAERTFKLKMAGDFAAVADIRLEARNLYRTVFFADVEDVASQALRKLIPPAQRIYLKSLSVAKSLAYQPEPGMPMLEEVLSQYKIGLETPYSTELHEAPGEELVDNPIRTLGDLLLSKPIAGNLTDDRNRYVYQAIDLLQGPPREIADLWFTLANKSDDSDQRSVLIGYIRIWLRDAIVNDARLEHPHRLQLIELISELPGGEIELNTESLKVKWSESPPRRWVEVAKEGWPRNKTEFRPSRNRVFQFESDTQIEEQEVRLSSFSRRTQSYMTLLHDLIALSPNSPIAGTWITPEISKLKLVVKNWRFDDGSFDFSWGGGQYRSFWGFDRFVNAWNSALNNIQHDTTYESEIPLLAAHWMAAHASVMLGEKYPWDEPPRKKLLVKDINVLIEQLVRVKVLNKRPGAWRRQHTLINFGLLMAPEYGLPSSFVERFFKNTELVEFWHEHQLEILDRRIANAAIPRSREVVPNGLLLLVSPHTFFEGIASRIGSRRPSRVGTRNEEVPQVIQDEITQLRDMLKAVGRVPYDDVLHQANSLRQTILENSTDESLGRHLLGTLDDLQNLGSFGDTMLRHPFNQFDDRAFCPSEYDLFSNE